MLSKLAFAKTLSRYLCGLAVLFSAAVANADVAMVHGDELQELLDQGVAIIDVRRQDEWLASGVVENSHLLTFFDEKGRYDIEDWLAKLHEIVDKDEPFILICEAGIRTGRISKFLDTKLGYTNVYDVAGGIRMWINADRNVVSVDPGDDETSEVQVSNQLSQSQ